jgi:hypothetical protein
MTLEEIVLADSYWRRRGTDDFYQTNGFFLGKFEMLKLGTIYDKENNPHPADYFDDYYRHTKATIEQIKNEYEPYKIMRDGKTWEQQLDEANISPEQLMTTENNKLKENK